MLGQCHTLFVVRTRQHEGFACLAEVRQQHNVLHVLGSEALLATDVEQGAHAAHAILVQTDAVGCIAHELRVGQCFGSSQSLAVCSVVTFQQVNCLHLVLVGVDDTGGSTFQVSESNFTDHVVDGAHDERIQLHGHGVFNTSHQHRNETIQLRGIAEGFLDLEFSKRHRDFKGDLRVEELGRHLGFVEHVRRVVRTVSQVPRFVLAGSRHFRTDLLQNRTVFPRIHKHGRYATGIQAVDENHLADVVHQSLDVTVNSTGSEDFLADVDDVGQVFFEYCGFANHLFDHGIDEGVKLCNLHFDVLRK